MITLVIVAIAVIALYTGAMTLQTKEIPVSISSTVYVLPKQGQWLFTLVMWLVGFSIAPTLFEISGDETRFLAFFTIGGILGVGASPVVAKEKNTFHNVCAVVAGLASQLLVYLNSPHLLLLWFLYVGYTLAAKDGSKNLFWVEVACMLTVFAYCLIR